RSSGESFGFMYGRLAVSCAIEVHVRKRMQASKTAGMNFPKWFISSPGRFSTALICNLLGTQILAEKGNSTQEYLDRATTQPHSLTISSLTFIVFVAGRTDSQCEHLFCGASEYPQLSLTLPRIDNRVLRRYKVRAATTPQLFAIPEN